MVIDCIVYFMRINILWSLIDLSLVISIISIVASVLALIVALIALYLQIKSNETLKRIKKNINKMEENVQKISEIQEIQNKVAFEIEKKRLINFPLISFPSLSEENIIFFKDNINTIFYEHKCDLSIIEDKTESICSFAFIKEGNKPKLYALPKIFYLFDKKQDTPYFCVQALEGNETIGIQQGEYYYLSYDFDLSDKQIVWYLGKKAPMFKGSPDQKFKVSLSSMSGDGGDIPSANDFCKDC